jgi:hypothetical protein
MDEQQTVDVHPDTLKQIKSRVQRAQTMGDVAEQLSIPEQMWLSRYAEDVPFLLDAYDQQRAELEQARETAQTAVFMLREHERIAKLVGQTPWFMAPMSSVIEALDALARSRREGE